MLDLCIRPFKQRFIFNLCVVFLKCWYSQRPEVEATRGQKRAIDTLKPELKAAVLVMGSELGSPARAVRNFNH